MTTLSQRQEELELRGLTDGELRYTARVVKAYSHEAAAHAAPVRHLLGVSVEWVSAELRIRIEEHADTAGGLPAWVTWVDHVGPEVAAYLTLKAALNGVGSAVGYSLRSVATSLMRMMLDEVRAQAFKDQDEPGFANAINHRRGKTRGARSDRLLKRMRYHGVEIPRAPSPSESILVGSQLLAIMVDVTGLFSLERNSSAGRRHRKQRFLLVPTESTAEWLRRRDDQLRLTMPIHPPCVIPPRDWAQGVPGGYHYDLAGSLPLVRRCSQAQQASIAQEPMPLVYSALNTLQRTPWRINARVLEIVRLAIDGKIPAVMPDTTDDPIPPRPAKDSDPEEIREWRRAAADIHQSNSRRRLRRADAERAMVVAEQVRDDGRIYFPYTLDFRGRAYPSVEFLNPHGPDIVRGMLEFSDGAALSRTGIGWLAVHGANCLGTLDGTKLTRFGFQERVDAIRQLGDRIRAVAADPLGDQFWTEAEDPWRFLAFCFEWAEYLKTGHIESHIPVALDGASNGLQHFSAMLRDPVGAAAVNLVDGDRPADIYSDVADAVREKLESVFIDDPMAALWLRSGLLTRSLVKRPVMTLAYGATRYGFVDQLLETLRQDEEMWRKITSTCRSSGIRVREACQGLSSVLWESLSTTVSGALSAMSWLQQSAEQVSRATGGPVSWSVPITGFPARQEYWKPKRMSVKTLMAGTLIQPSVYAATNKPLRSKILNAISPNVVHSLDAAMMCSVVVACAARGAGSIVAIHDSFGVHAEHVPVLSDSLRVSMGELYSGPYILDQLATQWRATGAEIPCPPLQGSYDPAQIRDAMYAFS